MGWLDLRVAAWMCAECRHMLRKELIRRPFLQYLLMDNNYICCCCRCFISGFEVNVIRERVLHCVLNHVERMKSQSINYSFMKEVGMAAVRFLLRFP